MWAFPQQIVPLSFELHQQLAEEYNGAAEWGYRGLKTLCIEGNISLSNLRSISKGKKPKKPDVELPEDLDWIDTDIIDGWAHLGGADSAAQVHPYKFTLFILKKVLETGAVDLVTGKATEVISNDEGQATGVKYTTFIDKRNTRHNSSHLYGRTTTPAQPTTNKSSLHHPDNPTFNNTLSQKKSHPSLHAPIPVTSESAEETAESPAVSLEDAQAAQPNSFRNIHSSDYSSAAPVKPAPSISESSENSSTFTDDDDSVIDEVNLSSEDSNSALDVDITTEADGVSAPVLNESSDNETEDKDHIATLHGDQIVLTLGPWTSKLLPSCPISGLRAHSITIQPAKTVSPFALFTEMRTSRTSYVSPEIYPRRDEVYVCGEGDTFSEVPESTDDVEILRDRCDELFKHVGDISPQLKGGRILKRQACYLPVVDVPSHSGPFIGSTNVDRLYLASGHSCWGINNAPATGLLMAEILLDGEALSASVDGLEPEFYFDAASNEV